MRIAPYPNGADWLSDSLAADFDRNWSDFMGALVYSGLVVLNHLPLSVC